MKKSTVQFFAVLFLNLLAVAALALLGGHHAAPALAGFPFLTYLQGKALTAGANTSFDASPHPAKGLVKAYMVRLLGTLVSSNAGGTACTYATFRDTILAIWSNIQIFAPRYNNQMMSGNLSGSFWAREYEDAYGDPIPMTWNGSVIDEFTSVTIANTAQNFETAVMVPFELPMLGVDRIWACPPAHLFRGDVQLQVTLPATLTATVGSDTITLAAPTVRWLVQTVPGDIARVPVVHRWMQTTISADTADLGRGYFPKVQDNRVPGTAVAYDLIVDGENVNGGQVQGIELVENYRTAVNPVTPEQQLYTPITYIAKDCTMDELLYVQRSLSIKLYGATSATWAVHALERPSDTIKQNVSIAMGLDPAQAVAAPMTPKSAPLGLVHQKIGLNGPRTLMAGAIKGPKASPKGTARVVPTVPGNAAGAAMASTK